MHKEQAGLQSEADDESGLAEGFGDSGDDAVERRQVRESERRGASAGGPVRAYRIVSHLLGTSPSQAASSSLCIVL